MHRIQNLEFIKKWLTAMWISANWKEKKETTKLENIFIPTSLRTIISIYLQKGDMN